MYLLDGHVCKEIVASFLFSFFITVTSRYFVIQNEHVEKCNCIAARSLMRKWFVSIEELPIYREKLRTAVLYLNIYSQKNCVVGRSC